MLCDKCGYQLPNTVFVCPKCSTKVTPYGNDLLTGLGDVRGYIVQMNNLLTQFWDSERNLRQGQLYVTPKPAVSVDNGKDKMKFAAVVVIGAITLAIGFYDLLFNKTTVTLTLMAFTFVMTIIAYLKTIKPLFYIGVTLQSLWVVVFLIQSIPNIISFAAAGEGWLLLGQLIPYIECLVVGLIAWRISLVIHRRSIAKEVAKVEATNQEIEVYNQQVEANNQAIAQHRGELSYNANQIGQYLIDQTSHWYPVDYYSLDAVEDFMAIVRNHQADTVKEMINVYQENQYRNRVLNNLDEVNNKLNQSLYNQQQMLKLQRTANVLALGNLAANMATASNTARIAETNQQIAQSSAQSARHLGRISDKYTSEPPIW